MRYLSRLLLGTMMVVGLSGQALAHAHLESAVPPPNAQVTSGPDMLLLQFSERLEPAFCGLALTGPGQAAIPTGDAALAPGDARTLVVPIQTKLANGTYTVTWHALSADGHKSRGSYLFTVAP
ncbi:hypothetical protein UB46_41075 [Burkholderiaceae bacterium 16]|nr:hypothetical protein UB46_41075 [Burkholderiaceae bacterium 16]